MLRVSHLHEGAEIEVMIREPVEVLEEQLQLVVRQPFIVPLVSREVTIRAEALRPRSRRQGLYAQVRSSYSIQPRMPSISASTSRRVSSSVSIAR